MHPDLDNPERVMSVISAITQRHRTPGRYDVCVDGEPYAVLSVDAISALGLSVGKNITGLEERIASAAAELHVYDRALNIIAARARSAAEVRRALVRNGEAPELVDRAVARLAEQGFLNDEVFAQTFTRFKVLGAGQSRRRVQAELARKGVARDVTDAAIATVFEEEGVDQRSIVEQAARKKLRSLAKLEPAVRRRRLYGFLARRGYDGDDIRRAMEAVGEELQLDEAELQSE